MININVNFFLLVFFIDDLGYLIKEERKKKTYMRFVIQRCKFVQHHL